MKKLLFTVCSLWVTNVLYAQYNIKENNVWNFGYHAGLNFNSGTAVPIQSAMNYNTVGVPDVYSAGTIIGGASVCDTAGQLLFYTSGDTIYNKNNQIMPNGYGLLPVAPGTPCGVDTGIYTQEQSMEASQGALIVPVLSNPNQYYVFSLQRFCFADADAGRLYYCVVDMSLNNGLGDVVATQKGIQLDSVLSEKMIAVPGDNCDMWVLVHGNQNDTFYAFNITAAGLNPVPVMSEAGNISGLLSYTLGDMKISPNRSKLTVSSYDPYALQGDGAELDDFDPATGIVSNAVGISTDPIYGTCFSPDNTKLYLNGIHINTDSGYIDFYISQYDISLSTTAAIIGSRVNLDSVINYSGDAGPLALGPDSKIYTSASMYNQDTDVLNVINFPNEAGTAAGFTFGALTLDTSTFLGPGLPNTYMKPLRDTVHTTTDTALTLSNGLTLQIPSGYFSYLWNDGTTDSSKAITDTGTYWVTYGNYCTYRTDTFVVRPPTGVAQINGNTIATLNVYPSPAQTTITITINGMSKINGTLLVTDALGRTVMQQTSTTRKQTMNVSQMAAGVYTIEYVGKEQPVRLQQRLVITK